MKLLLLTPLLLLISACGDQVEETHSFNGYDGTHSRVEIYHDSLNNSVSYRLNNEAERKLDSDCLAHGFLEKNVFTKNTKEKFSVSRDFEAVSAFKILLIEGVAQVDITFSQSLTKNIRAEVSELFTDVYLTCLNSQLSKEAEKQRFGE
jgi:hypothetical protein